MRVPCVSLLRGMFVRSNLVLRNLVDVGTGCGSQAESRMVGSVAFAGAARAVHAAPVFAEAHHRSRGRLAAGRDGSGESQSEDSEELHFGVWGW